MNWKDTVVVITGASRGIGRATAIAMAEQGANVVCTARSTDAAPGKLPGTLEDTVRQVTDRGVRGLAVPCDISDEEQVSTLAARAIDEFGRVDVLINNAATNYWQPLAETSVKRWDLVMNVNLRGTFLTTRTFLPRMLERGEGRIVNVSSGAATDAAITAELGIIPYAVSKAAVEKLTETLALEVQPSGIAVNCLRIEMAVATEGAKLLSEGADLSGWETPEAIADALMWLAARPLSETGQVLNVADVKRLQDSAG
ncbi:MAG: SDR family NAD(P)-dependent oxidoreductase [Chloroflexi bacterium]|nr:SDR family NAD(P)-dependent oxidoreductase [Chloroflexota bacterium]